MLCHSEIILPLFHRVLRIITCVSSFFTHSFICFIIGREIETHLNVCVFSSDFTLLMCSLKACTDTVSVFAYPLLFLSWVLLLLRSLLLLVEWSAASSSVSSDVESSEVEVVESVSVSGSDSVRSGNEISSLSSEVVYLVDY